MPRFLILRTDGRTDTRTHGHTDALNHEKHFEYMSNHNRAPFGRNNIRTPPPGEPLRSYDLQMPIVISRGETVTLVFDAPGIQLTVRARALEDVADGEVARFVNLQSNRTIEALADGAGRARVGSSAPASF